MTSRPFNRRAFAGVMAALSGISLPVSGLYNHLHQFDPMTETRHAWMAAHNVMALLFVIFAGWHIFLNRRALWAHLRDAAARTPSREALTAAAFVTVLLTLAVAHAVLLG